MIDFVIKPFRSPGKTAEKFIQSEWLKKDIAREFFLSLYDGTPKKYPRGDMLLFISVTSKFEAKNTS